MINKNINEVSRKSIKEFLKVNKLGNTLISPLAADASFRKYYRIYEHNKEKSYVLMDAPPELEPIESFLNIGAWLKEINLPSPEVYAKDTNNGYLLLEDFGNVNISQFLNYNMDNEKEIYKTAIDILIELSKHKPPLFVNDFSPSILMEELSLFIKWYLKLAGIKIDSSALNDWNILWNKKFKEIKSDKKVLVLRDYHSENLMWNSTKSHGTRIGLLDFQDALSGHQAYDLVSLLQDVRRKISSNIYQEMQLYFMDSANIIDQVNFLKAYNILGTQRNIKILGIFSRLAIRDNKKKYLKLIPYTWSLVNFNLKNPELSEIKIWFDKHIPKKIFNYLKST